MSLCTQLHGCTSGSSSPQWLITCQTFTLSNDDEDGEEEEEEENDDDDEDEQCVAS